MPTATITGFGNLGDPVCPHCNGPMDEGDDLCEDCAEGWEDEDSELDGESGEACDDCGSTENVGRSHGRWICDECDDMASDEEEP